jgi:hypothetical protein
VALTRARLAKLEKVAIEKLEAEWETFKDRLHSLIPSNAFEVWGKLDDFRLEYQALPPERQEEVSASQDKEVDSLFERTGLEKTPWLVWANALRNLETNAAEDKLDLFLRPSNLPQPPCDPSQALETMKGLDYPSDFSGTTRFDFVWYLAIAKALIELRQPPTPDKIG